MLYELIIYWDLLIRIMTSFAQNAGKLRRDSVASRISSIGSTFGGADSGFSDDIDSGQQQKHVKNLLKGKGLKRDLDPNSNDRGNSSTSGKHMKVIVRYLEQVLIQIIQEGGGDTWLGGANQMKMFQVLETVLLILSLILGSSVVPNTFQLQLEDDKTERSEESKPFLDTSRFHLFPPPAIQALDGSELASLPHLLLSIGFFSMSTIVGILIALQLVRAQREIKRENSANGQNAAVQAQRAILGNRETNMINLYIKFWLGLHATVQTILLAFFLTSSIHQIIIISQYGASRQNIAYYYTICIIMPIGAIVWICTFILSQLLGRIALIRFDLKGSSHMHSSHQSSQIPWGTTHFSGDYMREVFRILVVLQNFYLERVGIRDVSFAHSLHQLALLFIWLIIAVYNPRRFFNEQVDTLSHLLDKLVLTTATLLFVRVSIKGDILMFLLISPMAHLVVCSLVSRVEEQRRFTGVLGLIQKGKMTALNTFKAYIQLAGMVQKLNDFEHQQSYDALMRSFSDNEQILMITLFTHHRRTCSKPSCICREYLFQCYGQFSFSSADQIHSVEGDQEGDLLNKKNGNYQNYTSVEKSSQCNSQPFQNLVPSGSKQIKVISEANSSSQNRTDDKDEGLQRMRTLALNFKGNQEIVVDANKADEKSIQEMPSTQTFTRELNVEPAAVGNSNLAAPTPSQGLLPKLASDIEERSGEMMSNIIPVRGVQKGKFKRISDDQPPGGLDDFNNQDEQSGYPEGENQCSQAPGEQIDLMEMLIGNATGFRHSPEQQGPPEEQRLVQVEKLEQVFDTKYSELSTPIQVQRAILQFGFKSKNEAKAYFFKYLIGRIFDDYQNSQKDKSNQSTNDAYIWQDIKVTHLSFIVKVLKKPFKAVAELMKIKYQMNMGHQESQGIFNQMRFSIAEKLLMEEVQLQLEILKNKAGNIMQEQTLEISSYLEMSEKQGLLETILTQAVASVNDFWAKWNINDPQINRIFKSGRQASKFVSLLRKLSSNADLIASTDSFRINMLIQFYNCIVKDGSTAQFIQQTYYTQNKVMHRSNRRQNSGVGFDSSSTFGVPIGIVRAEAIGDFLNLKFALVNEKLEQLMNSKGIQLVGSDIRSIMPQQLSEQHDEIIKRFFSKGHANSSVFGKKRTFFIKDLQGLIKLVHFKLDFSFNRTNSTYQFITTFEEILQWKEGFAVGTPLQMDSCLFFLTNENFDVTEISQSVIDRCDFQTYQQYLQVQEIQCKPFNFQQFAPDVELYQPSSQFVWGQANERPLIVNQISKIAVSDQKFEGLDPKRYFYGVVNEFRNTFRNSSGNSSVYMQGFQVIILNQHPNMDNIISLPQNLDLLKDFQSADYKNSIDNYLTGFLQKSKLNKDPFSNSQGNKDETVSENDFNQSMSSQSSLNSVQNSHAQASIIMNLLFSKRSPRTLKFVALIFFLMIVSFVTICIYNVSVFSDKHASVSKMVLAYAYSTRALINFRQTTLELQTISQITNLNPAERSPLQQRLLTNLTAAFKRDKELASINQDKFEQLMTMNQDLFNITFNFYNTQYLSSTGDLYLRNITLKHFQQLYLLYLDQVNFTLLEIEKPPINVTSYPQLNYKGASDTIKNIYFILQNGAYRMQDMGILVVYAIVATSDQVVNGSLKILNSTIYVSICVLTAILVAVIPILFTISLKHFSVLKYMLMIPQQSIDEQITRCNEFMKLRNSTADRRTSEFKNAIRSLNGSIGGGGGGSALRKAIAKDESGREEKGAANIGQIGKLFSAGVNANAAVAADDSKDKERRKSKKGVRKSVFLKQGQSEKKSARRQKQKNNGKGDDKSQLDELAFSDRRNEEESKTNRKGSDESEEGSESTENEEHSHRRLKNGKKSSQAKNVDITEEQSTVEKSDFVKRQVDRQSIMTRLQVFAIMVIVIMYLNGTLLVSYFQVNEIFKENLDATQQIRMQYKREIGAVNLVIQLRQNIILNRTDTLPIYSTDTKFTTQKDAVAYYLSYCLTAEKGIALLEKVPPNYILEGFKNTEKLLGSELCSTIFANEPDKIQPCTEASEGILLKGIDVASGYLINQATQLNMIFSSTPPAKRTASFLHDMINNEKLMSITDLLLQYLEHAVVFMENKTVESTLNYFDTVRSNFKLMVSLIISFTCAGALVMGVMVYRKIKRRLTQTQNILILLPLDEIEAEQRTRIEKYLNS